MGKFKKGDKVKLRAGSSENRLHQGQTYEVKGQSSPTPLGEWIDLVDVRNCNSDGSYQEDSFELVAPEFKVGDRVKLVKEGLSTTGAIGKSARIESFDNFSQWPILLNIDGPVDYTTASTTARYTRATASDIELLPTPAATPVAETWVPKVGDRVVWNGAKSYAYTPGKEYEILRGSDIHCDFILSDDGRSNHYWDASAIVKQFSLAATPFTIEAGKFYKTRDGRKVGPMEKTAHSGDRYWVSKDIGLPSYGPYWCENGAFYEDKEFKFDLIAEWAEPAAPAAPAVATASNDNAPKFKVGDRVVALADWGDVKKGEIYTIPFVDEDGDVYLTRNRMGGYNDYMTNDELQLVTSAPSPSTPTIVALIENGTPKPSASPKIHSTTSAATTEASRLADLHKGQEFGVFVLTSTAKVDKPVYEHEWQTLAADGQKLNAVRSLISKTGMSIKPAFDAVDYFNNLRAA